MTKHPDGPVDAGLQSERTALSWQRTTLAFVVGSLVAARLLAEAIGPFSFLIAAGGLVLAAVLFFLGHRRYRSTHAILVTAAGQRVALTSAVPLFMWAATVLCLGITGTAFIIATALVH